MSLVRIIDKIKNILKLHLNLRLIYSCSHNSILCSPRINLTYKRMCSTKYEF